MGTCVWKLVIDIDGFGGKSVQYFDNFDKGIKALAKSPGFYYDKEKGQWDIEYTREVRVDSDIDRFSIIGIPSIDEGSGNPYIRWAKASIEPVLMTGEYRGIVYELVRMRNSIDGMKETVEAASRGMYESIDLDKVIFRSFSKKIVKEVAKVQCKDLPRIWNDREFKLKHEESIDGFYNDYLSIREYNVK